MRGAIANPERPRPIGGECVYPEAPTCRQDIPVPGDVATRHDPGQTGNVWDGEGP